MNLVCFCILSVLSCIVKDSLDNCFIFFLPVSISERACCLSFIMFLRLCGIFICKLSLFYVPCLLQFLHFYFNWSNSEITY